MSDEDLLELDELVGEWADAASKDDADEDLLALDTLADEWAHKDDALNLDAGEAHAADPETPEPEEVEEDWAGRTVVSAPRPPDPEEPITLPKRPDPVTMPPLPDGDFSDEAKQGDRRYASPVASAEPGAAAHPEDYERPKPDAKEGQADTASPVLGAGVLVGGAALAGTAGAMSSSAEETQSPETDSALETVPAPTPPSPPEPMPRPAPVAATITPAEPAPAYTHANDDEPIWMRWLPFGLIAGGAVAWLSILAVTGQGQLDETSPPRVLEQAARVSSDGPVEIASVTPTNPELTTDAEAQPSTEAQPPSADAGDPADAAVPIPETPLSPVDPQQTETAETPAEGPATNPDTETETAATDPIPEVVPPDPEPETEVTATDLVPEEEINANDPAPHAETTNSQGTAVAETEIPETDPAAPESELTIDAPVEVAETTGPSPAETEPVSSAAEPAEEITETAATPIPEITSTETEVAAVPEPATPRPAPPTMQVASLPSAPTQKPRILTASPGTSPNLKPASINRSIDRLQSRTTTTHTATSSARLAQRVVSDVPLRSNVTYRTSYTSANFVPLTAVELLQDDAAKGARIISTPSATARFNADVKRALQSGADGSAQSLTTPDGRLLALRIISTQEDQIRSMSIPRSPLVVKPSTRMVLEGGKYRTIEQVHLRAGPSEGANLQLLARGVLLESIGTMGESGWKLVGQQGRALGYLKADELQLATDANGGTSVSDAAKTVLFDVAQVRTRCRNAQYAIDGGGASGAFTACRVYGGEWVLERGGDLTALSPGRLVFKR